MICFALIRSSSLSCSSLRLIIINNNVITNKVAESQCCKITKGWSESTVGGFCFSQGNTFQASAKGTEQRYVESRLVDDHVTNGSLKLTSFCCSWNLGEDPHLQEMIG